MLLINYYCYCYCIDIIVKNRKVRICTSQTKKECIVCHCIPSRSKPRALRSVSNSFSDYLLQNEKIIIKKNHSICNQCKQVISNEMLTTSKISNAIISKLHLEQFAPWSGHRVSHQWINRFINKYIDLKELESNYEEEIKEKQQQIDELKQKAPSNRKYRRIHANDPNYDYDAEKETIPQESTKWKNRVHYDLMAEADCQRFTGHPRSKIIDIGMICEWNPELIFHARHFMYCYHPRRLQAQYFGWSHTNLGIWIKRTLVIMNESYALPFLINGKSLQEQHWDWNKIHEITPEWCYLLRECIKTDPDCPNIITADGTYQYVKCPETDQDSRKRLWNPYKNTTLVKVHIWSATNGQPLAVHCHWGDGFHA